MSDSEKRLRASINRIADQLCMAIDGRYDFHVHTDSDDLDIQKLSVLSNFVLESVRRNILELEKARDLLEERVEERTRRLDLIIRGANDGVWEWDFQTDELHVSRRWLAMSGCEPLGTRIAPEKWMQRIHPQDQDRFSEAVLKHANGLEERFYCEYLLEDGRGGYRAMVARGICDRHPDTGEPRMMAGTQTDITRRKFIDPRTGLPNAAYLELMLSQRLDSRAEDGVGLLMVVISNLSLVRDSLRPHEERKLAREVRYRLDRCIQPGELVALLADNTPVMLLRDDTERGLRDRAKAVMQQFDEPLLIDDRRIWLSLVIGAVPSDETRFEGSADMLQATRTMLRRIRTVGTGSFLVYHDDMRQRNRERLDAEQTLRNALRLRWVESFLQPLVNLQTGEVDAFEALCRIRHPEAGLISPGLFIPVAEETGLIRNLSDEMLRLTLPLLNDPILVDAYGAAFTISVNLSPAQLHDPRLAENLLASLDEAGADPRRLKVEITETAVMADADIALSVMNELRRHGIAVALDDFGAGYSSLGYLRQLPLDQLKIDRSLISGVDRDNEKRAILEMILTLCERLDLSVVVEGIENELELSCVLGMGAHIGQGFLFSRPLARDELVARVPRQGLLRPASDSP
ncbi:putative bifunctional diguanylate cyclase/phosphodiesterase [Marinobacter sp. M1N3S26]|uniref:putative bifunctional diguanylate cyclase/phosphodiesterase n=1 Tax=unclassified Marinobacter TaxID=83889 RepID=UPI00387B2132